MLRVRYRLTAAGLKISDEQEITLQALFKLGQYPGLFVSNATSVSVARHAMKPNLQL